MTDQNEEVNMPNDDLHQYLREIYRIPMLTQEAERDLAMRTAAGDEDAIRQMVKSNLRLVFFVAKQFIGRGVPLMDLIQEGSIGLLAAARKFDYTRELRFSTYATKWIRQGITRCLINSGSIRVPRHTAEKIQIIDAARSKLRLESGEEPTVDLIAQYVQLPAEKVAGLLQLAPEVYSLDAFLDEEEKTPVMQLITDLDAIQPHETLVRQELEKTMHGMLQSLTERQQTILRLHFGLEDGVEHSLEEIGRSLGISKERTRQIEQQAMSKLLKLGTSIGLEDFLDE